MGIEQRMEQYDAGGIAVLRMELGYADLLLQETDEDMIRVEAQVGEKDRFESMMTGDTLEIRYEPEKRWRHIINTKVKIALWLPKGKKFECFSLEIGAGNANLTQAAILCTEMMLEVGAGNVEAGTVEAAGKLQMEIGAGNAEIAQVKTPRLDVECGVGNCEIGLWGKESDFNYDISCGIGNISINGRKTKRLGAAEKKNASQPIGTIKLSCGVGNIDIRTQE